MAEVYLCNHNVPAEDIELCYGLVSAVSVFSRNVIMDKIAKFKDFIGGRIGTYEKMVEDAKDDALKKLAEKAAELGANAVVNVCIEITPTAIGIQEGTQVCALAYGTAVKIKV